MDTTTIDLKAFCEPEAPHLAEPFWREGHMYATNGKICVRVPAEPGRQGLDPAAGQFVYFAAKRGKFRANPHRLSRFFSATFVAPMNTAIVDIHIVTGLVEISMA